MAHNGSRLVIVSLAATLGHVASAAPSPAPKLGEKLIVDGWIEQAAGHPDVAERLLREAAGIEDTVGLHPVSPASILPAREVLGDLLLELKRPADAQIAYEASLALRPSRLYATTGAMRAAKLAGNKDAARTHARALLALTKDGDNSRPEIAEARIAAR